MLRRNTGLRAAVLFVAMITLILGILTGCYSEEKSALPPELLALLPDAPLVLAVKSSLLEAIDATSGPQAVIPWENEQTGESGLLQMMEEIVPGMSELIDRDLPLAVTVGMPAVITNQGPPITVIIPLAAGQEVNEAFLEGTEFATVLRKGNYAALSTEPAYTPADSIPELAVALPAAHTVVRFDLAGAIDNYRGMAEMGLMAMTMAAMDTTDAAGGSSMSPEEAQAMANVARSLMDSADRLELAVHLAGQEVALDLGFRVKEGSPLQPGPQPDFDMALELTRLLPPGEDFLQLNALDYSRQMAIFRDFYTLSLSNVDESLPGLGEGYRQWYEQYLDSMDLFYQPNASNVAFTDDGIQLHTVMKCDDAADAQARVEALMLGYSELELGVSMIRGEPVDLAGVQVQSFTVDLDLERFQETMGDGPQPPGMPGMQAQQLTAFMRKVVPGFYLCNVGNHLIYSADPNLDNLTAMIRAAEGSGGSVDPRARDAAKAAGPGCQQVTAGDLRAIVTWAIELAEEFEMTDEDIVWPEGAPVPFTQSTAIDGVDTVVRMETNAGGMQAFIKQLMEMD